MRTAFNFLYIAFAFWADSHIFSFCPFEENFVFFYFAFAFVIRLGTVIAVFMAANFAD
jgi:hypothetical protein